MNIRVLSNDIKLKMMATLPQRMEALIPVLIYSQNLHMKTGMTIN